MKYIIGCDIGTSGTKTILYDLYGAIMAEYSAEYKMYQPKNNWAEQDPNDWWEACVSGIRHVIINSYVNSEDIKAIGLTGQMHSLVMLDKDDNVLRPAILWCDQRSDKECIEITKTIGKDKLLDITGNPALTGFSLSKFLWVKNNEPKIFNKCKKILLAKDYIRYKLTGVFATDVSDASGMQMLDIKKRKWSYELLDEFSIDYNMLPKVYESTESTGHITEEAALITGLKQNTIVSAGASDQAAAAIGNGVVSEGISSVTIGSSGVVFSMTNEPLYDPLGRIHTFCHAVPYKWHLMGVTQGAGLSMNWFKETFYREEEKRNKSIYKDIDYSISKVNAGACGVIFLPYLMGERTPHLDPNAKGVFFGIEKAHTKSHLARAVMEGVTYSLYDCLNLIKKYGPKTKKISLSGGGAKSSIWRQMIADVFDEEISLTSSNEAGCIGAAILASVASGLYDSVEHAASNMLKTSLTLNPNKESHLIYIKTYDKYKNLYQALKNLF